MSILRPVILCGGSGTRLWPLSRGLYPKQFMDISGETIFGKTIERAMAIPKAGKPIVICNNEHRFLVAAILHKKGIKADIILEPMGKNTAPAIAIAAISAMLDKTSEEVCKNEKGYGESQFLLVLPSDHAITPFEPFAKTVEQAAFGAERGLMVTFGVKPTYPETGYGYIRCGESLADSLYRVDRFVEKPDALHAEQMLSEGGYFWNSGMFMFRASTYLDELEKYAPEILKSCKTAWEENSRDLDFIRLGDAFAVCPSESIDYGVMEHTDKACLVPLRAKWSDLGSWESMHTNTPHDASNNSCIGDVLQFETEGCYLHSSSRLVATIGIKDLCVVETADAVLVVDRHKSQKVKELYEILKKSGRQEINTHLVVHRPWGSYENLLSGNRFKVKRITVNPGCSLSLQLHHKRAEHWVVVSGTANILRENNSQLFSAQLGEDMSTYIPKETRHRLENKSNIPLEIIEVQTGEYIDEDDIVRFEDNYGRSI